MNEAEPQRHRGTETLSKMKAGSLLYRPVALAVLIGFCWYGEDRAGPYEEPELGLEAWLSLAGFFGALLAIGVLAIGVVSRQWQLTFTTFLGMALLLGVGAVLAAQLGNFVLSIGSFALFLVLSDHWRHQGLRRMQASLTTRA